MPARRAEHLQAGLFDDQLEIAVVDQRSSTDLDTHPWGNGGAPVKVDTIDWAVDHDGRGVRAVYAQTGMSEAGGDYLPTLPTPQSPADIAIQNSVER